MPRKTYAPLTREQIVQLTAFVVHAGRYWKRDLRRRWENPKGHLHSVVYALRNSHGPSWLKGYTLEAIPPMVPSPVLRPYQQFAIKHIEEIVEQRPTSYTVATLKASCKPVEDATRLESASAFLSRFMQTQAGAVRREAVRHMLDMLAMMTADDVAELDRIRRYLRGE